MFSLNLLLFHFLCLHESLIVLLKLYKPTPFIGPLELNNSCFDQRKR